MPTTERWGGEMAIERDDKPQHDDIRRLFEILKDLCEHQGLPFQAYVAGIGMLSLSMPAEKMNLLNICMQRELN